MGEVGFVCERTPCGKGGHGSAVKVSALSVALPPVGLKQGRLKMNLKLSPLNKHPGVVRFHIIVNFLKSAHVCLSMSVHVRVPLSVRGSQKRAPGHLETEL